MAVTMAVVAAGTVSGGALAKIVRIIYRPVDVYTSGIGRCSKLDCQRAMTGAGCMGKWFCFGAMIRVALAAADRTIAEILSVFSPMLSVRWRSVMACIAIADRRLAAGGS